MKRFKLGEICEVVSGTTPKTACPEYWDGDIDWITPAELSDDTYLIEESIRKITQQAVLRTGLKPLPKGTVLLSSRAPIGKVAIAGKEMYCNQGFKNLICSDRVSNVYLYWFLKKNTEYLNSLGRGATFKEISKSIVENIEIDLPSMDEQIDRAVTLKKCWDIIALRKQQLTELDIFIKARFVEMFGNPIENPKGWKTLSCRAAASKIGSGATPRGGRGAYETEGISLIRSMNVYNNRFEYKDLAHITNEQAEKLDNVAIEKKDVLLNITGASVARCCIVPDKILPARVNQHVSIIRCKEILLPEFVCHMLTEDNYQKQLWSIATSSGATREAITKQQIEELIFITPPLELQNQFAAFVRQVDKSKIAVQKALDETQLLFDSLMQQYFG